MAPSMLVWPSEEPGAYILLPVVPVPPAWSMDGSGALIPAFFLDQGWDAQQSDATTDLTDTTDVTEELIKESERSESPRPTDAEASDLLTVQVEESTSDILQRSFLKELLRGRDVLEEGGRLLLPIATLLHERSPDGTLHPLDGQAEREMRRQIYRALRKVAKRNFRGIAWRLDYEQKELQVHVANLDEFRDFCALHSN
eukprot:symbB.v1.2.018423.t1/scaffold1470.1/size116919/6